MESGIRENLESWALESGIQFKESGIRNPSSTTKNPESIIQDCLRFPYIGQCGSCSQMKSLGEWHAFGSSVLNIVYNQLVLLIMRRQAWFVEGEVVIIIIKKVTRLLLGVNWEKRCWFKLQLFIPWWLKDGNLLFCQPRSQSSSTIPDVKSSVKLNRMRRFGLGTRLFFCCFAVILGNWTKTSSIDYLSRRPSVFEKSKTVSPVVVSSDQKMIL